MRWTLKAPLRCAVRCAVRWLLFLTVTCRASFVTAPPSILTIFGARNSVLPRKCVCRTFTALVPPAVVHSGIGDDALAQGGPAFRDGALERAR